MTLSRKTLAMTLAGGFFAFVTLLFCSVVMLGWSLSRPSAPSPAAYPQAWTPPSIENPEPMSGRMVANLDGMDVEFAALKTDYDVEVRGDLIAVQLTQRFENPADVPLDVTYQFPLHEDAAVYAMSMRIGDEVVRAQIQQKEQAKHTFETAKEQGKAAALMQQFRPNLFQQSVANLMPGKPIEVELRYVHAAERVDGRYHVTLPLVVGPRFVMPTADEPLPAQSPVSQLDAPSTIDPDRVSIAVRIDAGMPIFGIESTTHEIDVQTLGRGDARVQLAAGRVLDNKHFELTYALAGTTTQAGLLADYQPEQERGYFSLLIEPPAGAAEQLAVPREMVFVLDCSGSMAGQPMAASKAFMRRALRALRPTDSFRIIRFSDNATEYSQEPIPANDQTIEDALAYVDGLSGGGGTRMSSGVRQALTVPAQPGTIRLVTFMTDGYIGRELDIARLLREEIGDARLFAIGVGAGVNRYLIDEMARAGRGFARYVDPTEDVDRVALEIANRLQTPVMTDIHIRATDGGFDQFSPNRVPDLFAGQSVRLSGTYTKPGDHTVWVEGKVAGERVQIPVAVRLPAVREGGQAVRLTWARSRIADLMHTRATPVELRQTSDTEEELQAHVTQLGLDHALVTQWTSFVAVSEQVYNYDTTQNHDAEVPVSQVVGVGPGAYGGPSFSGGPTPEPGIIGGLLLTFCAAGGAARRRKKLES